MKSSILSIIWVIGVIVSGSAIAETAANGRLSNGLSPNGLSPNGRLSNGLSTHGTEGNWSGQVMSISLPNGQDAVKFNRR